MEVTILEGCKTARGANGKIYEIEGIEFTRESGLKIFYGTESHYFKTVTYPNVKFQAYSVNGKKIMLI